VSQGLDVASVEPPPRTTSLADDLLESFGRYLLTERGLAPGTVRGYVNHARRFLAGITAEGLTGVTAGDVTRDVLEESGAVSVSTAQSFIAGLGAFLLFCLFVQGREPVDLSQAALGVTGRRRSTLPLGSPRPMPGRSWTAAIGAT